MRDKTSPFRTQSASTARATQSGTPSRYIRLTRQLIGVDSDACKLHPTARLVALTIANALNSQSGRWAIGYDALGQRCGVHRATVARHAKRLCHGPDALFMRRRVPTMNGNMVYEYAWLENVHAFRQSDATRKAQALDRVRAFCGLSSTQGVDGDLRDQSDAYRKRYMVQRAACIAGDVPVHRAARDLSQLLRRALKTAGLPQLPARDVFGVSTLADVFDRAYRGPSPSPRADAVRRAAADTLRQRGIDPDAS